MSFDYFELLARYGMTPESLGILSKKVLEISKRPHENAFSALINPEIPEEYRQFLTVAALSNQPHLNEEQRARWMATPDRFLGTQIIRAHIAEGKIPRYWHKEVTHLGIIDYLGHVLWPYTYKCFSSGDEWAARCADLALTELGWIDEGGKTREVGGKSLELRSLELRQWEGIELVQLGAGATQWVNGACRTLTTSLKYAAAMACTSIHEGAFEDIKVPWPAFMVNVPPGILKCGTVDYDRIFVMVIGPISARDAGTGEDVADATICRLQLMSTKSPDSLGSWRRGDDAVRHVLFREIESFNMSSAEDRTVDAAKRIVTGLLYTIQHTTHWRERTDPIKRSLNPFRNHPPGHRNIVVGAPISVNATPAVVSFINDDRRTGNAPPAFQQLVRGHTKRQICGVGGLARKVIWIEPYWRGPEDAPILTHAYRVGT